MEDNGNPKQTASVTVRLSISDLNDNDPSLNGPFAFTIQETDSASNTVLYTATANSNDGPTDVVSFYLSDTSYFDISSGN